MYCCIGIRFTFTNGVNKSTHTIAKKSNDSTYMTVK